ncbi:hypothetical protein BOTBODRAFT_520017 [Botryobasidium botryosum FD-172 SS1]|uniref:Uncharacterized protein n=1 Tax=Botryobasidium botryosum (strain FD-172 SS1) TaxID=930990 RepID=A0A067N3P3_BOTB1|nr:hypothetical protein BOTBODRAFT_520017 [Botryobasidium botryosum FD-172 SS1]
MLHTRTSGENPGLALDRAGIAAFFLEAMLYGVFLVLFFICVWVLLYRRTTDRINRPLLATSVLLFILSTLHMAVDIQRFLFAFINFRDLPGGPAAFFANLGHYTEVMKIAVYVTQTLVGDSLVVYRVFVVWSRDWRIIVLPTMLLLSTAITGYGTCYHLALLKPGQSVFLIALKPWITSYFAITLTTNVMCTGLLAYRIWNINRGQGGAGGRDLSSLVVIVVESGAIYSSALIALLTLYVLGNNGQYVVLDAVNPIIGIVFSLIIVRVGLGITTNGTRRSANSGNALTPGSNPRSNGSGNPYPMKPLSVNVSRVVHGPVGDEEELEASRTDKSEVSSPWAPV